MARVRELASGYEQEARRSVLAEQASVARLRELEHTAQSHIVAQQATMSEIATDSADSFLSRRL